MASPIADYPRTGIEMVIIGAGFAGLTAAIEAHLKGHEPVVLEKAAKWEVLGDIISISKSPLVRFAPPGVCLLTIRLRSGPNAG
jgi:NADPH-dependent 2,4-dienoyl-CoA reductase/sulfur reductase-like enzyme